MLNFEIRLVLRSIPLRLKNMMKQEEIGFFANRSIRTLFIIVLMGICVRIWGIDWGLPDIFEEATPMRKAWAFWGWETGKLDLNPHFFNYPTFYFYVQFFVQILYFLVGLLTGLFSSLVDFKTHVDQDLSTVVVLGRLTTAAFGAATLFVAFVLGKKLWNEKIGLLAAFFLAFNTLHVEYSMRISVDVPLTFFVMFSYVYIYLVYDRSKLKDYIIAGVSIGLAIGTKYTAAFLLIPLFFAHVLSLKKHKKSIQKCVIDRKIIMGVLMAGLFFFVASPFCLIDFRSFWRDFSYEHRHMNVGHLNIADGGFSWFDYLVVSLKRSMGIPLQVLSVCGVLFACYKHNRKDLILLCFPVLYFLVVGSWAMRADRYLLPIIPFLFILAARLLHDGIYSIRLKQPVKNSLFAASALILIVGPGIRIANMQSQRMRSDTRTIAKHWIEENIPKGSTIAMEFYGPQLRSEDYATVTIPVDVVRPEICEVFYDRNWYLHSDYIIISSYIYDRFIKDPSRFHTQHAFYEHIENDHDLVKTFDSENGTGPKLKIYKPKTKTYTIHKFYLDSLCAEVIQIPNQEMVVSFLSNISRIWEAKGLMEESLNIRKLVLQLNPGDLISQMYIGNVLLKAGKTDQAIVHFKDVISKNPNLNKAYIALSNAYRKKGLKKEAIAVLQRSLAADHQDAQAHHNLGVLYSETQEYQKSLSEIREAIRIKPDYWQAYESLGKLLSMMGQFDEGIAAFKTGLTYSSNPASIHLNMGIVYYVIKDYVLSWTHMRVAESLGVTPPPDMMKTLREIVEN